MSRAPLATLTTKLPAASMQWKQRAHQSVVNEWHEHHDWTESEADDDSEADDLERRSTVVSTDGADDDQPELERAGKLSEQSPQGAAVASLLAEAAASARKVLLV